MGKTSKNLFFVWLLWTVILGLGLLLVGVLYGFDSQVWVLALIGAGLLELWLTATCIRSWFEVAAYRWGWWL